ncbi:MAG: HlyD family efflux transporter periplasmic adaptor subunit [Lawsonibacter sp.]|nr:HlyD family efflux transporter periplasmic adaptor subunit [Lawsonibacter sp.]
MPEITTPQTTEAAAAAPAPAPAPVKPPVKKPNTRRKRNLIIGCITAAALGVGGFFLFRFLNHQDAVNSEIQSQPAGFGSIQSMVTGSGNAMAKESAAITLTASGTVQEVLVAPGDIVTAGQPLYTISSQEAQDKMDQMSKEMQSLYEEAANLTVTAPFAGKLMEVQEFQIDDNVAKGQTVAQLVNDKKLKLSLYFSYAYEGDIRVGQSVSVSIPAVMDFYTGTVEKINKVSFISPEGAVHFEVVVVFNNPGTLTAGMDASAVLTASDGTDIYPYENGKTQYYETRTITSKAAGPVVGLGTLLNYADVYEGEPLLYLGSNDIDERIAAKQEDYDKAKKDLDNFNAVAPIDGTVTSCTLSEGMEVKSGDTVITISNTTNMVVEISVDDRNIAFVQPGMMVQLSDWNGMSYMGTVSAINMGGAQQGTGMTSYPVTLTVDNYDGSLLAGMWLDYSFVASQSDDCITVPMQSVKYVSGEDGETFSVVFIKAGSRPENAVDLDIPEPEPGQPPLYPSEKDGFYPVSVETGLSDSYNVEIKSGLNGDEEVFVNFLVESAWG